MPNKDKKMTDYSKSIEKLCDSLGDFKDKTNDRFTEIATALATIIANQTARAQADKDTKTELSTLRDRIDALDKKVLRNTLICSGVIMVAAAFLNWDAIKLWTGQ